MQVGDRVLVLVEEVPDSGVEGRLDAVLVPEGTYGLVEAIAECYLPVAVLLDGDSDTPWYFNESDLEVVADPC